MKNYQITAKYIKEKESPIVEQVCKDGSIEWSLYKPLKMKDVYNEMKEIDQSLEVYIDDFTNKTFLGKKNKLCILVKNIVFVGNKHYSDEKRIEIPRRYHDIYETNLQRGIHTIICGYYNYKGNKLITVFDTEDYMSHKNTNQSAGWVFLSDLIEATNKGYFSRIDRLGNHIYVMNPKIFKEYIVSTLRKEVFSLIEEENKIKNYFSKFFSQMNKTLVGLDCYKEMKDNNYSQWKQSSWEGFYPEFLLQKYLDKNHTNSFIWWSKKGKDEIDLDLRFPKGNMFFGDMKSDVENGDTQGNKKETIEKVINKGGKVWYVVLEWTREMDKDHNGITTKWWNQTLNDPLLKVPNRPKPLDTYLNKMKYQINIKRIEIFEINKTSFDFLKVYIPSPVKGVQRAEKLKIDKRDKQRFRIFSQES